jgi:hypothetical protein
MVIASGWGVTLTEEFSQFKCKPLTLQYEFRK